MQVGKSHKESNSNMAIIQGAINIKKQQNEPPKLSKSPLLPSCLLRHWYFCVISLHSVRFFILASFPAWFELLLVFRG